MKIAISGKSGCGNTTVSRKVAEKLGLKFINYTFRSMAQEKGLDFDQLCHLAEKDNSYDVFLDNRQKELASEGNCVVGSRLAIWIIDDADIKIFLDASTEERAERIRKREGGTLEEVLTKTIARDKRDSERYKNLYSIDNSNYSHADLVIDTNQHSAEEVAQMIADRVREYKKSRS